MRQGVVLDADILHGRLERIVERGPSGPPTARILPVTLMLDTHADLELDIHLLDLNFKIWQEFLGFLDEVITHAGSELKDLSLGRVTIHVQDDLVGHVGRTTDIVDRFGRDQVIGVIHPFTIPGHKRGAVQPNLTDVHVHAVDAHEVTRVVRVLWEKIYEKWEY